MTNGKRHKVVDPTFATGKGEYEHVIKTIEKKGKCPFCSDNFKYHKHPVIKRFGGWFLTRSSWPYKNAQEHFLIISETHKEKLESLTDKDHQAAARLARWARKKFRLPGGCLALAFRFGMTEYTGATVCHAHFHLIVPKIDSKTGRAKTVNFPIG